MTDDDKQPTTPNSSEESAAAGRGFWTEAWVRFRKRKLAMTAFVFVACLAVVAILSPIIAGTKPIVCKYKGNIYFPALSYFNARWENPVFFQDKFRKRFPENLEKKDPGRSIPWCFRTRTDASRPVSGPTCQETRRVPRVLKHVPPVRRTGSVQRNRALMCSQ